MKRMSLKLREAHKGDGSAAFWSVAWGADGFAAVASDPAILIHDTFQLPKPMKELLFHKDGVPALTLSPDSASGSIDHSVQI